MSISLTTGHQKHCLLDQKWLISYWIKILQTESCHFQGYLIKSAQSQDRHILLEAPLIQRVIITQTSSLQTCGSLGWYGAIRSHQPTGIVMVHLAFQFFLQVLSHMLVPLDNAAVFNIHAAQGQGEVSVWHKISTGGRIHE